jgi:O-antigen biosynthesis protein WbqP
MTYVTDPTPSARAASSPECPSQPEPADSDLAGARLRRYASLKRFLDVCGSALLLAAFSPIFLLIGIWVRLDSPGPAIYRQRRVGRGGYPFTLYKFRTMRIDAPVLPTDQMARQTVSYYTRSGRILRRVSLDELPQLWNVLRGDMALVGPRPALPSQEWLNTGRAERGVHDLRPGITGWAQVCGRDDLPDPEKLEHDAEYRRQVSPAMDARILWRTASTVISGRGLGRNVRAERGTLGPRLPAESE